MGTFDQSYHSSYTSGLLPWISSPFDWNSLRFWKRSMGYTRIRNSMCSHHVVRGCFSLGRRNGENTILLVISSSQFKSLVQVVLDECEPVKIKSDVRPLTLRFLLPGANMPFVDYNLFLLLNRPLQDFLHISAPGKKRRLKKIALVKVSLAVAGWSHFTSPDKP